MGVVNSIVSPLLPTAIIDPILGPILGIATPTSVTVRTTSTFTSTRISSTTTATRTSTFGTTSSLSASTQRTTSVPSSIIVTSSTASSVSTSRASSSSSSFASKSSLASSSASSSSSSAAPSATGPVSASAKILIIAKGADDAQNMYSGLQGYGIPYEVLTVPSGGVTLPALNSSLTAGNYGGIVIYSDVSYQYSTGWNSALTDAQWQALYDYQTAFGVRMVQLDVYPGSKYGTTPAGDGCCEDGVEQLVSFSNTSAFSSAGLKLGATVSSQGIWHYPATIADSNTWEVAKFGPGGPYTSDTTAAVISNFPNGAGTRQQMAFFIGFATSWSTSSNFLQHGWITWVTRGLYAGNRRLHLSTQIDDVQLGTLLYEPSDVERFRLRPGDLAAHVPWMAKINQKLPAGSNYFIELGHNGNGNIENATLADTQSICNPSLSISLNQPAFTGDLEFQKALGTGTDYWSSKPADYPWNLACSKIDPLLSWVIDPANLNSYAHVSHTFTHENFNNATYFDTNKEITWNQAWFKTVGIDKAAKFSANGLIPPAITGMHNGDAIKGFLDNGIKHVVGDNTRPVLMNQENSFWPLTSTTASNGYNGLEIIPRWATTIYYNCDLPQCTLNEWIKTSAGSGDFQNLLTDARTANARHLLGLHQDPYMFHQANMRQIDVAPLTIDGVTGQYSLLQAWTETVVNEMVRLVDWPMITLKHDDIANKFIARRTRDQCQPQLTWNYSSDRKTIVGATVSANGNSCGTAVPVTFPGPVVSTQGGTAEQLGNDPLTVWVNLSGSPVTFQLKSAIAI